MRAGRVLLRALVACALLFATLPARALTVTVGAEDDWFPFSGVVGGEVRGLGVDLVRAAFEAAGVDVKLQILPYSRCVELVKRGELVACFDTVRNSTTEKDFVWPREPLFRPFVAIYATAASSARNLAVADLEHRRVIVTRAYEYGESFDANPRINRVVAGRDIAGFRMLAAGRGEFMVAYAKVADEVLRRAGDELARSVRQVGVASQVDIYLAFSHKHPQRAQMLELFDQGFAQLKRNGRYREIERHWRATTEISRQ